MSSSTDRSPWVYVGCGCAIIFVLVVVAVLGAGFVGFRGLKEYAEEMKDPAARAARTLEVLGGEQLPAGYNAQIYLRIPFVMEMALLSDGEPVTEDSTRGLREYENLVFFLAIRDFGDSHRAFERFLEGESDSPAIFDNVDVDFDFDAQDILGRGSFTAGDQDLRWVAQTGELDTDLDEAEGVLVLAGVDCPTRSDRVRILAWFQRHEDVDAEAIRQSPTGTPADESAFRDLVGHFNVCAE